MQKQPKPRGRETDPLYIHAEVTANQFNLKCLAVLCFLAILSEGLRGAGLFVVPSSVMLPSVIAAGILFLLPIAVFLIHDRLLKRPDSILANERFKILILAAAFLGVALICTMLTFHAVILLAVPPLIAAQYRGRKRLFWWVTVASLLLVPISVYGGFFLGAPDRNFIKGMMTEEEFAVLSNRRKLATPRRMAELFLHYVLPRWFSVLAVVVLAAGITRRNSGMIAMQRELAQKVRDEMERHSRMQNHVIDALATLIETRDESTGEHVMRTKRYVTMIANAMKRDDRFRDRLTDADIERIENAAPLHDVGKIAISDTILLKPARLTAEEFDNMKTHTVRGGRMIRNLFADLDDPQFLQTAEEIAVSHHEKWDGSGYPNGKKGEEIPLSARIMAVADVYDALVSFRVYKSSISPEKALDTMMAESGTHFDPDIMRIVDGMRGELIAAANAPAGGMDQIK